MQVVASPQPGSQSFPTRGEAFHASEAVRAVDAAVSEETERLLVTRPSAVALVPAGLRRIGAACHTDRGRRPATPADGDARRSRWAARTGGAGVGAISANDRGADHVAFGAP